MKRTRSNEGMGKSVLIITTSHDQITPEKKTGVWFEEFAVPYERFVAAGYDVTVASIQGGNVPIDPASQPKPEDQAKHESSLKALTSTTKLSTITDRTKFDAVFLPGGHGTMWDLPNDPDVISIVGSFLDGGKVVGSVCHGPACFVNAKLANGDSVVKDKNVTGFSNTEEKGLSLDTVVPFMLEDKLKELGATFSCKKPWADHVVVDGKLVTGQNPASSAGVAEAMIKLLA